jgi:NitT/TauT family transport system substrate-binding protein
MDVVVEDVSQVRPGQAGTGVTTIKHFSHRFRSRRITCLLAAAISLVAAVFAGSRGGAADLVRVGEGPFICGGAFYIARDKGYFKKLNLEIETKHFEDGSLAVPSIIAGELDFTLMSADASLFNSIAKGAPLVVVLDGGNNRRGFGATVINVTQALYDEGVRTVADFARLKGKKFGVAALGSVNQYNAAQVLLKAKLDPAKDVQWIVNVPQPDLMRMLGQSQVDATDLAYQLGFLAQSNKWGPIVVNDDQIVPDAAISIFAVRRDFLAKNRDAVVRFAMAYLHGVKEFNAAAKNPGAHPDIVDILAHNSDLNKPELVSAIAPNWSYIADDGVPLVNSIMEMQDFWSGKHFSFVKKKVSRQQLFDLNVAKEAKARLAKEKPFGN